jgi:3-oxoacyl-[acyl-carrier-protein] synthase II
VKAVVVASDIVTPYGKGIDRCWEGLLANRSALAPTDRFETRAFQSRHAGIVAGLSYHGEVSLVMQMLAMLFEGAGEVVPEDAALLLATTKGEIDFLERSVLVGRGDPAECHPDRLLGKAAALTGAKGGAMVVSAACTSSAAAAAHAAAMIRSGRSDCVLVVACDGVTEFIYSGFSSLMAMDAVPSRPFDRSRSGLTLGEAAAFALVMGEERARREKRTIRGEIAGWGMSDDANHMTGPSRESEGLIRAIGRSLRSAGVDETGIGFVSAHGTGTPFNDAMEMRAFRAVFKDRKLPVYSVKGGIGHTMGAAGLVDMIVAQKALEAGVVPPTVNLVEADDDAAGWVSARPRPAGASRAALVTNAGFGGVNTALVIAREAAC